MPLFESTFDSLRQFTCPDWFQDAKLGFWSHWGPQSVPMCGDWYARHMYVQDHPQYRYHLRHYGHPSTFGYKDICALWKAERFDPDGLMTLFKKAGARYFVGQAMHHDHFFNYPSKLNRFNSMAVGPGKDICGLWKTAAEREGLPFGLTEHLGAAFSWWYTNKGCDTHGPRQGVPYDGSDPAYRDFYFDNREHANQTPRPWYTTNARFRQYWLAVMKEVIDRYEPDLLYSDGSLPFGAHWQDNQQQHHNDDDYRQGLEAVAHLYNTSIRKHGTNRALYNQKDRHPDIYSVGVLDIEKSQLPGIQEKPWQTDTCIGDWFYDARQPFKTPGHVIEILVDIISKNGNLLLNILQRPDGSIDDETRYLLDELAAWFAISGEAVHGTRPWRIWAEGDSQVLIEGFREDRVNWNPADMRFTRRGNTVYAFLLCPPESRVATIKSFTEAERVKAVRLLGHGPCPFQQSYGILNVKLPPELPTPYVNTLAMELESHA